MLDVIYDDGCGFCMRSMKVCRAFDVGGRLRFHGASRVRPEADAHGGRAAGPSPPGTPLFPELANADLQNAMFAVDPDRTVTRGFFAFRRIAREVPLMWPLLVLLYFPGSGLIGPPAYAWIARNRHRFGCGSAVCELPEAGPPRR
jgi:predicted DCC family thiol-disulfide oxidoreductase YuxK